ncbi:MAG: DUF5706 domain-containing protein [Rhodospirillales bacterium]|nr:DUF5706 domain-containing protein [Rhodospirillales bacterium]MDH3790684.1 DUF5706 domain-containing protein [Rhodospirillales bacterium]MDH3911378.1 DUF5706 domain-containing protein [Rhodospirillales bacterium]MDH3918157.1 DUF5706 domain-containing protein [Rhodospirillales bacterium]MDH3969562.1 DUF5706 domain-containing protein [Rhodospirillales bacterium]
MICKGRRRLERSPAARRGTGVRGGATHGQEQPALGAHHERLADFLNGAIIQNINLADRKAGIIFTLVVAAGLFLLQRAPEAIAALLAGPEPKALLWALIMLALVGAAVSAFSVIFPRIRRQPGGILFWGDITGYAERRDYLARVARERPDELAETKLGYCHDLSGICAAKFRMLRLSMTLAAAGLVLFLVHTALG